jgi:hypothetical protein
MKNKLSFLVFNFGKERLRNLWHTMNVINDIQSKKKYENIEFICIEHGDQEYSKEQAEKTGFKYEYYFDPLLASHRSTLRNKAVDLADGQYVILHDNDIIPDENFFDDILNQIETYPEQLYFSNFNDVINLTPRLTEILIKDMLTVNKFGYGYINGTDTTKTENFEGCAIRGHGYWTFTEATGGSFTVDRDTFIKHGFDESFTRWGAEDNMFKLNMISNIGWERFGLINKSLLHSDHSSELEYDPRTGIIQVFTQDINTNRKKLYDYLNEVQGTLNTDSFEIERTGIHCASIKKIIKT